MNVRIVGREEIPMLLGLARSFFKEAGLSGFNDTSFTTMWPKLIDSGAGHIFGLFSDSEPVGALGALLYTDINTGQKTATEAFWFVDQQHRGHGLCLLNAYESWAKDVGCTNAIMVHLKNIMPDRLSAFYKRKNYKEIETHYIKEF